ncbi:cell wall biogenesis protein [Homalodisca vitripennis]|nr:cell wall biogenesis protein [Homalodisca vitripennis]
MIEHLCTARVGLMHIGVFILLLLSGERNFGVRLNKPYTATIPMDIPVFTGTHADLLITVFHKIITTGHQRLQPLFDCLYCCRNSCRLADHSVPQDHHYRTPEASATV